MGYQVLLAEVCCVVAGGWGTTALFCNLLHVVGGWRSGAVERVRCKDL